MFPVLYSPNEPYILYAFLPPGSGSGPGGISILQYMRIRIRNTAFLEATIRDQWFKISNHALSK